MVDLKLIVSVIALLVSAVVQLDRWAEQLRERRAVRRARARRASLAARAADEYHRVPTGYLTRSARRALAELARAVRSGQQELPLAPARLGTQAARELATVLGEARTAHAEVLLAQQALDETPPDDERTVRDHATQILRTCRRATSPLQEQLTAIAAARALEADVDAVLTALDADAARERDRAAAARQVLAMLGDRHPPVALAPFVRHVDRADALLAHVGRTLTKGHARAVAGAQPGAVGCARLAEETLAQVGQLLAEVESADAELTATAARLASGVESLTADLADVERLASDDPDVADLAREVREALADAASARAGAGDPRTALRRITAAEVALDAALAPHRVAEQARHRADEQRRRAEAQVDDALAELEDALAVTRQLVRTLGGVGPIARTRLHRAEELRSWAVRNRTADPVTALTDARRATDIARRAEQVARRDAGGSGAHSRYQDERRDAHARPAVRPGWRSRGSLWGDEPDQAPPVTPQDDEVPGGRGLLGPFTTWQDDPDDRHPRAW
ncbi:hypothetical protein Cfla_0723 [Cellulomonas flavigena DSM 20109]|uniref:Uncharacterized protein n=1 Tax=Cellulomonas flavigena (strain ATCC 482 / DSM 20109 / BCRC 11376 / JCM 18109 / NBRC 3775 / NCIMB 8073 / NRS 134) TaxID=446466 RepID=D5UJB1_CELFN|nr:hypothetical protein [Cellulomonas flavigena]ADG73634.1 hypothetical protein Cfla_0723 [Cellulomonas flavigena DSM 20109]